MNEENNVVNLNQQEDHEEMTPEKLQQMSQESSQKVLQEVQEKRHKSVRDLQDRLEGLYQDLQRLRSTLSEKELVVIRDDNDKVAFSLENTLREVSASLNSSLEGLQSINTLVDMLCYDMGQHVHNLNQTQKAMLISNGHVQTLLEVLKTKDVITEEEMSVAWEKIVNQARQTKD